MEKLKSRPFWRYLLSYTVVLCLPVVIVSVICGQALNYQYVNNLAGRNDEYLRQVSATFDDQLEQLVRVAYLVQADSDLNVNRIGDDVIYARAASAKLLTYQSVAVIPSFLYIYRSGDTYTYTSGGRLTPQKLFGEQYVYAHHTLEDFHRTVDATENIVVWGEDAVRQFGGSTQNCLTIFISVKGGFFPPRQRSVFLIPTEKVPMVGAETGSTVLLYSPDGSLLLAKGAPCDLDAQALNAIRESEGAVQLSLCGEGYYASHTKSTVTGWTYVLLTPSRTLSVSFGGLIRSLLLALSLVLLMGGLAVYWLAVRQYRPLQNVMAKVRVLSDNPDINDSMAAVAQTLDELAEKQNEYRSLWETNRDKLIHDSLSHLLLDSHADTEALLSSLDRLGLTLDKNTSYVIVLVHPASGMDRSWETLVQRALMLPAIGLEEPIVFRSHPSAPLLMLILPSLPPADLSERLEQLQEILEDQTHSAAAFGVSLPARPAEFPNACRQAESALKSRFMQGESAIAHYREEGAHQPLLAYPQKALEVLQWNLLQLDGPGALSALNDLVTTLSESDYSVGTARMVCFDIINTVYKCLCSLADARTMQALAAQCDKLASFSTVNELAEALKTLIPSAIASLSELPRENSDPRLKEMCDFIAAQCFDFSFSINLLAEHFGLSVSNLSHYFKNGIGKTVSEYVQELRRDEACRLLSETDLSVQVIGERIGMPNASSFIRSFKQQTGMTPGCYRELHGK